MGLGAFAHLPDFYINHKLLIELVRSYDVFSNTIRTSVGEFMITFEKVGYAFGLNCSGDLFEKRQVDFEHKLNDEEKEALNLFKGKTLTFVQDMGLIHRAKMRAQKEKEERKKSKGKGKEEEHDSEGIESETEEETEDEDEATDTDIKTNTG
ncbi:hypothetical protein PIB30_094032, partial [Stylosanthes scabra]|nr:hypothetical protein [Stylosanthes scabra]